jgi:hypothetical protein
MHRHNGRTKQISLLNTIITEHCFGKKKYNTKTHRYTTDIKMIEMYIYIFSFFEILILIKITNIF